MATRAGSIDPEILLYLQRHEAATAEELEDALEHHAGLLGLGGSARVEELEASTKPEAELALAVFTYRIATAVGAMATAVGGLDALVFTAGVGENSALVRARVCARLAFLGVELDGEANASAVPDADISAAASPARVWVIHAREDAMAARAARTVV